jgi:hypothetical protein
MTWVTPAELRTRRPGAPGDDTLLQAWIDDAEVITRAEYPWIDEWITDDPALQSAVTLVVIRMVIRALATPMGVNREVVGDTQVHYTTQAALELTDADRALLDGHGPQTAFTVDQLPERLLPADWRWWWARGWDDENDFWRWVS